MTKDEFMMAQLKEIFSHQAVEECIEIEDHELFHICDINEKTSIFIDEGIENGFTIINTTKKKIYHLPVDNYFVKYLPEYEGKKCDCIIFDDRYFCFVELKLDVESKRNATGEAKKARKQLGTTIEFFKESFQKAAKTFLEYELEAYVAMQPHIYPRHRARMINVREAFLEQYKVQLFEKNEKEF